MVAQTRHAGQPSPKKLAFHEKLVGKGLSSDALLKRLKALHAELAELDQELVDVSSLSNVRKELISRSLLLHKERGVKAYTACCLSDILRLYAPDAPYTEAELRDIFQFFFKQLSSGLKGDDTTYSPQYFHLLESLSTVKSVVLVCDLPNAEELMLEIFRDLFGIVRRNLAKKIESFMADILVAIIDECHLLPSEVLETIMAQFMDKNARLDQPAYRLAVQVCNETAAKLQRHVALYFTDIIVSNSEEEDFEQIRTAHDLIKRLHASCPALLPSVIPQLEEELHAASVPLRSIATQVLGDMFSDKGGGELAKNHPSTWNSWLGRKVDKSSVVRLRFVEHSKGLYSGIPELKDAIETAYNAKLLDPDEKIRAAVCKVYSQLDYETAVHHVSEAQLRAIAGRIADRKNAVRYEAANSLAILYSLAYPEIENNDITAIEKFSWIPDELLRLSGSIADCRAVVEQAIAEHILPLPSLPTTSSSSGKSAEIDEVAWTDRLLTTMRYLSEKAHTPLLNITGLKNFRPTSLDVFVDACVKNNGGVIDENEEKVVSRLNTIIKVVASTFLDPVQAAEDLKAFAKLNENRLYKLLKTCLDVQTDLKTLVKATHDFHRRVEQSAPSITGTMTALVRRGSLRVVNRSSIPTLLKRAGRGHGTTITKINLAAQHAQLLLTYISKHCPTLYKQHVDDVVSAVEDEKSEKLPTVGLQALSSLLKVDPNCAPTDSEVLDRLREYAVGSNHRQAKFAARTLAFMNDRDGLCTDVVEEISTSLKTASSEQLVAHLAALAQFARYAPDPFEQKSDIITAFLLKKLLMVPILAPEDELSEEWAEEEEVSDILRAKVLALKIWRHRSMAHASSANALELSTPVLKILATLLDQGGSLSNDDVEEDPRALSRLRLQAAVSLTHLSTIETYAEALTPKFLRLAVTAQDSCYQVRLGFIQKLTALLYLRKLPAKYNIIPFLTAHDPEDDVKNMAAAYVVNSLKRLPEPLRVQYFELTFIRLLHLLAHHPDFATTRSELEDIVKYIQFYLEHVATADTVSLLYHMAGKGKTVRDAESQAHSENLYAVCEAAQELIRLRAQHHSWNIPSYPGKIKLPSDILRPQPNAEIANKIIKQTYLPPEALTWLEAVAGATKEKKERKATAKRKAAGAATTNGHTKRSRKKKRRTDDTEDELSGLETSDVEMSDPQDPPPTSDVDGEGDEEEPPGEELLGRGARSRAKARAKRQARAMKKAATPASSEG